MAPLIERNIAQCRQCLEILESVDRHDFYWCGCGAIFVDGGLEYIRRGARDSMNDVIELSEYSNDN